MAKPGSSRARAISNGIADLGALGMSDEQAWKVQAQLELALGKRCAGCGRRITLGLKFVAIDVTDSEHPQLTMTACTRDDCDSATRFREGATYMEAFEVAWLDDLGPDGPAFGCGLKPHEPADAPEQG